MFSHKFLPSFIVFNASIEKKKVTQDYELTYLNVQFLKFLILLLTSLKTFGSKNQLKR